jgi:hypothetical protein
LALGLLSGQAFICSFLAIWSDASQAFTSQIDPMGVVNETVEDRISVGWVVDDLMPAVHGELGCDDGRAAAVSLFENCRALGALPPPPTNVNVSANIDVKVLLDGKQIAAVVERRIVAKHDMFVNNSSGFDASAGTLWPDMANAA